MESGNPVANYVYLWFGNLLGDRRGLVSAPPPLLVLPPLDENCMQKEDVIKFMPGIHYHTEVGGGGGGGGGVILIAWFPVPKSGRNSYKCLVHTV